MHSADEEALAPLHRLVEQLASRLPSGEREDDVRRSWSRTQQALRENRGIEEAVRRLVTSLHRLDEPMVGGRRREFQRKAPAVGRLLETLQEEWLPILRRAGHRV